MWRYKTEHSRKLCRFIRFHQFTASTQHDMQCDLRLHMPKRTKSSASPEAAIKAWIPSGDVRKNTTSVPWLESKCWSHNLWSCYHPQKEGHGNMYVENFEERHTLRFIILLSQQTSGTISGENMWNQDLFLWGTRSHVASVTVANRFGSWFLPKIWANLPVPTAGQQVPAAVNHQGMCTAKELHGGRWGPTRRNDVVFGTNQKLCTDKKVKWKCQ